MLKLMRLFGCWLLILGVIILVLEGGARLFVAPNPGGASAQSIDEQIKVNAEQFTESTGFLQADSLLGWSIKPNLVEFPLKAGTVFGIGENMTLTTNSEGLRGAAIPPKSSKKRILAIGDSTTFGWCVRDNESWPAQLETILNATESEPKWEVINAGVNAYSSCQGLLYLENRGLRLEPDIVIASFWFNDTFVWGDRSDEETFRMLNAERRDRFLSRSRLYVAIKRLVNRIHFPRSPAAANKKKPRSSPAEFEAHLRAMQRICAQRGIPMIYVNWPLSEQVEQKQPRNDYGNTLLKVGQETGMPVVELLDAFYPIVKEAYCEPIHGNALGCRVAAEEIAKAVRALPAK